jgi:hypothetical protein
MTHVKEKLTVDEAKQISLEELGRPQVRLSNEPRKHPLVKAYRFLDDQGRIEVSRAAAEQIYQHFQNNQRIDQAIYLMCLCVAAEKHWDSANEFLAASLAQSSDVSFFREIAIALLDIADIELSGATTKLPLAETCLVLLTEYGLMLANHQGRSSLDHKGVSSVVEYISTSLLARSNINSTAMRISLVHFLAHCGEKKHATLQLNRVISRFGHSLLEDLLRAFFDDKKKGNAAFFFLVEHLQYFFSASAALANMSHDVLKHHMLKYPNEFPSFLASYSDWAPQDTESSVLSTRHISLLYRAAIDVYQRPLAEALGRVLLKHLGKVKDTSPDRLQDQIEAVNEILGSAAVAAGPRQILVGEFMLSLQALRGDARAAQRVISLSRAKRGKDSLVKLAKVGEKPTPLESMIQLAG